MDIEEEYDKIFRFCFYKVHNHQIAEDLTQEAFLRFYSSSYKEQGKSLHYLYTIARNLCIDEMKKPGWEPLPDAEIADTEETIGRVVDKIMVTDALMRLAPEDREILVLRYMNEEPMSVICDCTGLSRFALYRKLKQLKRKMRTLLEGGDSE